MSRTLILARHGRTAWNHELRLQGHADVPLDDVGRAQAEELAAGLAPLQPVRLWSSDLRRAHQTAAAIGAACGLPVESDPRLREYDVGDRSGMTHAEFADRFPAEYAAWRTGAAGPGEETIEEVAARTVAALRDHLAELPADGVGVAVMHGTCLKTALSALLDWPAAPGNLAGLANCSVAVLAENDFGLRLVAYNVDPEAAAALIAPDFASQVAAR